MVNWETISKQSSNSQSHIPGWSDSSSPERYSTSHRKEDIMGDKGGKKDKAKLQKQKANQQAKKKQGK
jgi:hypothetical protein